jgi:hypothetical protein
MPFSPPTRSLTRFLSFWLHNDEWAQHFCYADIRCVFSSYIVRELADFPNLLNLLPAAPLFTLSRYHHPYLLSPSSPALPCCSQPCICVALLFFALHALSVRVYIQRLSQDPYLAGCGVTGTWCVVPNSLSACSDRYVSLALYLSNFTAACLCRRMQTAPTSSASPTHDTSSFPSVVI